VSGVTVVGLAVIVILVGIVTVVVVRFKRKSLKQMKKHGHKLAVRETQPGASLVVHEEEEIEISSESS
jgi:hypothetical protein